MPRDPYWRDTGEWPPWRKQLKTIKNPIAEEVFTYRGPGGKPVTARVSIGKPKRVPQDFGKEWYCPIAIDGWLVGVMPVLSIGPVEALVNAGSVIRAFLEEAVYPEWGAMKRRPRPKKAPARRRTSKRR